MASTKQITKPTFKQRWDEDLKWSFLAWAILTPPGIAVFILWITVINLYVGWF